MYGFDNLIPLASQSFEDSFSSVSPGTPIISPGHSHSPSPAAQPPPDDVIILSSDWSMFYYHYCRSIAIYRPCNYLSHTHKLHPLQMVKYTLIY